MINNNVTLREYTPNDYELFKKWIYKDYVNKWLGEPAEWLEELWNDNHEFDYYKHYIAQYRNTPFGYCHYYECARAPKGYEWDNEPQGTFAIGYLIGEEEYLSKGLGDTIVRLICEETILMEAPIRIVADPMPENIISINLLKKVGFEFDAATGLYKLNTGRSTWK